MAKNIFSRLFGKGDTPKDDESGEIPSAPPIEEHGGKNEATEERIELTEGAQQAIDTAELLVNAKLQDHQDIKRISKRMTVEQQREQVEFVDLLGHLEGPDNELKINAAIVVLSNALAATESELAHKIKRKAELDLSFKQARATFATIEVVDEYADEIKTLNGRLESYADDLAALKQALDQKR